MDDQTTKTEFARLLRECQARLHGFIHSLIRDMDDADDLFQQTAIILWNKFADFDRSRSFFSWACGIARFEIANFLRSRSRQRLYFSDDLNLLLAETQEQISETEVEDRKAALSQCVEKLRERDRSLLLECYEDEARIVRVAQRMGRSSHSVHNSLRRIRRSLFECVQRTLVQQARTLPNG